jgi:resuscitation-promoting factor RpfB
MIRGISAGSIGAALVAGAVAFGPAIANGAVDNPFDTSTAASAEAWPMATVKDLPHREYRLQAPRHEHHKRASRASYRLSMSPQEVARAMLLRQGGSEAEWNCLDELWGRESGWEPTASNSSSGAYGIPQALPAYKMASAGSDWRTNPVTQIKWGLSYIGEKYGTACVALSHSNSYGYY